MILGIGVLVVVYARYYLSRSDPMGRFYAYLLLFQRAMVCVVLSDNILLLLVFWELNSLTPFLLIGYWRHLPEARPGARMALVVTGGGGLLLIAGMLMLGEIAGSYDLSLILQRGDLIKDSPLYLPMRCWCSGVPSPSRRSSRSAAAALTVENPHQPTRQTLASSSFSRSPLNEAWRSLSSCVHPR